MSEGWDWAAFAASALVFAAYEVRALWIGSRYPERIARSAHARMRVSWVTALSKQPGFEIVAVQALRNALMSATIAASTAALSLMGTITLAAPRLGDGFALSSMFEKLSSRALLEALLMLALFASYVCSAMAMRYFNHAGFVMSMPVASPERQSLNGMAGEYVERAGLLYSWGLRFFLMVAPLVAGIVSPLAMLPMTLVLVSVLWFFDRPAKTSA